MTEQEAKAKVLCDCGHKREKHHHGRGLCEFVRGSGFTCDCKRFKHPRQFKAQSAAQHESVREAGSMVRKHVWRGIIWDDDSAVGYCKCGWKHSLSTSGVGQRQALLGYWSDHKCNEEAERETCRKTQEPAAPLELPKAVVSEYDSGYLAGRAAGFDEGVEEAALWAVSIEAAWTAKKIRSLKKEQR